MSLLDESLAADATDESFIRELDLSIQEEKDPLKRISLVERQNAHLKRAISSQKVQLRDIKEKELDLASSDLNRLQERMEQLAAENKVTPMMCLQPSIEIQQELEKQVANGHAINGATAKEVPSLPVALDKDAPRSALDVLARESAAYIKKIESLEGSAAQLIQQLRQQEETEAEVSY